MPVFKHVLPRFTHLKHLTLRIEVAGKIAILQLAYLLETAPFLENLHLDVSSDVMNPFILPTVTLR